MNAIQNLLTKLKDDVRISYDEIVEASEEHNTLTRLLSDKPCSADLIADWSAHRDAIGVEKATYSEGYLYGYFRGKQSMDQKCGECNHFIECPWSHSPLNIKCFQFQFKEIL